MATRVLHIIGSGEMGGAERYVFQLAQYQHQHDDEVESAIAFVNPAGPFYDMAVSVGIPVVKAGKGKSLVGLVRAIRQFDVIHVHGLYPRAMLAIVLARTSCVYCIHGTRAMTRPLGSLLKRATRSDANSGLIRNLRSRIPTLRGGLRFMRRQWLVFFLKRYAEIVHASSVSYLNLYREQYHVPAGKLELAPLGLDFSALVPQGIEKELRREFGLRGASIVIGTVSNLRQVKRVDRLIEGFALFREQLAGQKIQEDVRLLVIGEGEMRGELEQQIKKLGLRKKVILAGRRSELADILSLMNVFVLPSQYESLSLATIEAMCMQRPVVVFGGSGGAQELVESSGGGAIVEDVNELADILAMLAFDSTLGTMLGERGASYVESRYSIASSAACMRELYNKVVNNKT